MFHVKHRTETIEPEKVGHEVRLRVESWLMEHGFVPPQVQFAERIEKFATAIAFWGVRTNLTAEPEDPSALAFHIIDSLAPLAIASRPDASVLRDVFRAGRKVLDLGAGAGFPGLVLAAATPADFVLVEARRKRASFLTVTAAEMGLHNVSVEPVRGDSSRFASAFDTVIARALARPAEFYRMAAAALKAGGVAILYANPGQQLDPEAARACGMGEEARLEYALRRGDRTVSRLLVVWRKR